MLMQIQCLQARTTTVPTARSQNITEFHVVVRTFFDEDMDPDKAAIINSELEQELASYTGGTTGSDNRNLRAYSRDLQGFCRRHCNDRRYGCKWCKINDIFAGVDCSDYCRRRETEHELRELLPVVDELESQYLSNRNRFTVIQDDECAAFLSSLVSNCNVFFSRNAFVWLKKTLYLNNLFMLQKFASDIAGVGILKTKCYLVPAEFTIPTQTNQP
jgi:hypothetical protein